MIAVSCSSTTIYIRFNLPSPLAVVKTFARGRFNLPPRLNGVQAFPEGVSVCHWNLADIGPHYTPPTACILSAGKFEPGVPCLMKENAMKGLPSSCKHAQLVLDELLFDFGISRSPASESNFWKADAGV